MSCCGSGIIIGDRPTNPIILGIENGDPAVLVRVMRAVGAAHAGTTVWVSGTTVQYHLDRGRIQAA